MKHCFFALVSSVVLVAPVSALAQNQALLTWGYTSNAPENDNPTFQIYQGVQGQSKAKGPTTTNLTYAITTGLVTGQTYCWEVTAVVGVLESGRSNEACKTFPLAVPPIPATLQVK